MADLPIDVVPGTDPPVFKWTQLVDSMSGKQVVEYVQTLPSNVEVAVQRMVTIVKQLLMENAGLRGQVDALNDRIGCPIEDKRIAKTQQGNSSSRVPRGKG